MVKINLIPYPEEIRKAKTFNELAIFGGSVFVLCLALFFFQKSRVNIVTGLQEKISELNANIEKLKDVEGLHTTMTAERDKTKARLDAINAVTKVRRSPIRHLDELTNIIPDIVWLTRFSIYRDDVAVSCKSMSYYDISKFYNNIKSSKYFVIDKFPSISESEVINNKSVYQFDLSFKAKGLIMEEPSRPPEGSKDEKKENNLKQLSEKVEKS